MFLSGLGKIAIDIQNGLKLAVRNEFPIPRYVTVHLDWVYLRQFITLIDKVQNRNYEKYKIVRLTKIH